MFHGTKVVDNYRWLEDGNSPETQKWVEEEMAYTRGMLDPSPDATRFTNASPNCSPSAASGARNRRQPLFLHQSRRHAEPARSSMCARVADSERKRPRSGRRQPTRRRRHHRARLVSALRKRQVCRLRHFAQRLGDEHAAHHRNQHRQNPPRHHRAHARRLHRLDARQLRLLLHALSQKRRRPRRPGGVQPPRLLSRS